MLFYIYDKQIKLLLHVYMLKCFKQSTQDFKTKNYQAFLAFQIYVYTCRTLLTPPKKVLCLGQPDPPPHPSASKTPFDPRVVRSNWRKSIIFFLPKWRKKCNFGQTLPSKIDNLKKSNSLLYLYLFSGRCPKHRLFWPQHVSGQSMYSTVQEMHL